MIVHRIQLNFAINPTCTYYSLQKKARYTVYSKTFEWENFHDFRGFSADRKSFPLESFAVYSI